MIEEIFKNKRANYNKLQEYGFKKTESGYFFAKAILDDEFIVNVTILNGKPNVRVVDKKTAEEYVLYLTKDAVGEFVGKVKKEVCKVLQEISDHCFDDNIFKGGQTCEVIKYIAEKYGDKLEYLWKDFPKNAIWRRQDNKKWYGLLVALPQDKLGFDGKREIEIINLRVASEELDNLIDCKTCLPAYHMNKKHWMTIVLNSGMPMDKIKKQIDKSYILALKK